jgi:lipid-binding SYLF domain-containing protein
MLSAGVQLAASAENAQDAQQLVDKARSAFNDFMTDKVMQPFRDLLKRAKGVYIAPQVLRGAFIFGASGGSGVLVAKDEQDGKWYGPAFYTIGDASFGFQAGAEASEIGLLIMTQRGVTALLETNVKLGGDVSLVAGPVGAGIRGETAGLSADIVSFARSKGLYGGVSVNGAVVAVRDSLNEVYYRPATTPTDILIKHAVTNPQAAPLLQTVARAAAGAPTARSKKK